MSEPRDDVGADDVQWVVVCIDPEYGPPEVYAAWDTETEAATWLDEDHLTENEGLEELDTKFCKAGASELDHYVVTVIDCT